MFVKILALIGTTFPNKNGRVKGPPESPQWSCLSHTRPLTKWAVKGFAECDSVTEARRADRRSERQTNTVLRNTRRGRDRARGAGSCKPAPIRQQRDTGGGVVPPISHLADPHSAPDDAGRRARLHTPSVHLSFPQPGHLQLQPRLAPFLLSFS